MSRSRARALGAAVAALSGALLAWDGAGCTFDADTPFRCSNGQKDGDEIDVDCGGSCGPCGRTKACVADADCATPLVCSAGKCGFTPVPIWVPVPSNAHPDARYGAGLAPAQDGSMLLFGGHDTGATFSDSTTWRLVGREWMPLPTPPSPPSPRYAPGMVFDTTKQKTLLYGGENGPVNGDLFSWSGSAWELESTAPVARFYVNMAYDEVGKNAILFGGITGSSGTPNDLVLWSNDTGEWSQPALNGAVPAGKVGVVSAFDSDRRRLVFYGFPGGMGTTTFELDPDQRMFVKTATTGPGVRTDAGMAYDRERRVVVLFGGLVTTENDAGTPDTAKSNETWEYSFDAGKGSWRNVNPATKPTARYHPSMAYDPAGHRIVLFGGAQSASTLDDDTWAYALVATPCSTPSDCGTGSCQSGVCCNHDCAPGEACDTAASPGRCAKP